jgi:hypothetical protein
MAFGPQLKNDNRFGDMLLIAGASLQHMGCLVERDDRITCFFQAGVNR